MPQLQGFHYEVGRSGLDSVPLVLLHGSASDERSLVGLADQVAPGHPYIAVRGAVEWEDGFAFFRRNQDRTLNYVDLADQTARFGLFLAAAAATGVTRQPPILLGYSNGAILAASLLLTQPEQISGAILLRPLSPDPAAVFPAQHGRPVLIIAGEGDERRAPEDVALISSQLTQSGAAVATHVLSTGHVLHESEPDLMVAWLERNFGTDPRSRGPAVRQGNARMLAVIRWVHTAIYVVMAASTFVLLYAGLTGASGPWLWVALGLLAIESAVFVGNGMKCPLTAMAVEHGATSGRVFDTFLPEKATRYTFRFFGTIMALGLALLVARWTGVLP